MTALANRYTRLVGIQYPIVQEGLGPFKTPKIAAAVSEAGGLGTVSMPGMPVDLAAGARLFREHIDECASLTRKPFAVNIPVGIDGNGNVLEFTDVYIDAALQARASDAQLQRQLTVLTTSAGVPAQYIRRIKDAGMIHQHKVGSTRQAVKAQELGVDVVIAAGFEMGGHASGTAMHSFVLMPNVADAIDIPMLLTGGVRDGRGLAAALALGADGVAMGTRFILSHDNSDWHPNYLRALLEAKEGDDVAFPGVYGPCRGLRNAASYALLAPSSTHSAAEAIRQKIDSMQRAQNLGDVDNGLVLTGQVASGINELIRIAEFVPAMAQEAVQIMRSLAERLVLERAEGTKTILQRNEDWTG